MPWPTTLHKLASEESSDDWSTVLDRVRTHPHEVGVQGAGYGQTVLHVACYRYPPPGAVSAFLRACPDAASMQNSDGETPLHLAMDGASEEVQLLLLRTRPGAASLRDRYGDTPLHLAAAGGASAALLRAMVDADPGAASLPNGRGETPLHLLGKSYEQSERERRAERRAAAAASGGGTGGDGGDGGDGDDEAGGGEGGGVERTNDEWRRAELLLRAAYLGGMGSNDYDDDYDDEDYDTAALTAAVAKPGAAQHPQARVAGKRRRRRRRPNEEDVPVLHAAAGCRCPRSLLRAAARLFPEQALVRDDRGRTPLAVAALAEVWNEPRREDDEEEEEQDEGEEGGEEGDGSGNSNENRTAEGGAGNGAGGAPFRLPPGRPLAPSDLHPDNLPLRGRLDLDAIIHLHSSDEESEPDDDDDDDGPPLAPGTRRRGRCRSNTNSNNRRRERRRSRRRRTCVVDTLVHLDPRAASYPDADGRLPLHLAVESGKTWDDGLRSLIWAAPRALETRDTKTRMYPFMIAATVEDGDAKSGRGGGGGGRKRSRGGGGGSRSSYPTSPYRSADLSGGGTVGGGALGGGLGGFLGATAGGILAGDAGGGCGGFGGSPTATLPGLGGSLPGLGSLGGGLGGGASLGLGLGLGLSLGGLGVGSLHRSHHESSANSTAVVTTVYELLRTLPELVSMGIPPEGDDGASHAATAGTKKTRKGSEPPIKEEEEAEGPGDGHLKPPASSMTALSQAQAVAMAMHQLQQQRQLLLPPPTAGSHGIFGGRPRFQ